jgi:hypothetical protein
LPQESPRTERSCNSKNSIRNGYGVRIPGCAFQFEQGANAPELSSAQNGRMAFIGTPGVHAVDISYLGFTPLRLDLQLQPVGGSGRANGSVEQRVQLQQVSD